MHADTASAHRAQRRWATPHAASAHARRTVVAAVQHSAAVVKSMFQGPMRTSGGPPHTTAKGHTEPQRPNHTQIQQHVPYTVASPTVLWKRTPRGRMAVCLVQAGACHVGGGGKGDARRSRVVLLQASTNRGRLEVIPNQSGTYALALFRSALRPPGLTGADVCSILHGPQAHRAAAPWPGDRAGGGCRPLERCWTGATYTSTAMCGWVSPQERLLEALNWRLCG